MKLRACLALAAIAACGSKDKPVATQSPVAVAKIADTDVPEGFDLRLSDGKQTAPPYDATKLAPATKLGDADVSALLARAPALKQQDGDQQAFALRPATQRHVGLDVAAAAGSDDDDAHWSGPSSGALCRARLAPSHAVLPSPRSRPDHAAA